VTFGRQQTLDRGRVLFRNRHGCGFNFNDWPRAKKRRQTRPQGQDETSNARDCAVLGFQTVTLLSRSTSPKQHRVVNSKGRQTERSLDKLKTDHRCTHVSTIGGRACWSRKIGGTARTDGQGQPLASSLISKTRLCWAEDRTSPTRIHFRPAFALHILNIFRDPALYRPGLRRRLSH